MTVQKSPASHPPATAGTVLTKALLRAADLLGLNNAALAAIVGLNEPQVSRLASGQRELAPGTKEAELAALLIRAYRSLDALVGHDDLLRRDWVDGFNQAFNTSPREAMETVAGLVRVVNYLDDVQHTSFDMA